MQLVYTVDHIQDQRRTVNRAKHRHARRGKDSFQMEVVSSASLSLQYLKTKRAASQINAISDRLS